MHTLPVERGALTTHRALLHNIKYVWVLQYSRWLLNKVDRERMQEYTKPNQQWKLLSPGAKRLLSQHLDKTHLDQPEPQLSFLNDFVSKSIAGESQR